MEQSSMACVLVVRLKGPFYEGAALAQFFYPNSVFP